jgi:hypothetical protein
MNLFGNSVSANQMTRTVGSGTNIITTTDKFLNYDRTNGNVILVLPKISSFVDESTSSGNLLLLSFMLSDVTPSVSANTMTINCDASDNINGSSSFTTSTLLNLFLQATPSGWLLLNFVSATPDVDDLWALDGNTLSSLKYIGTLNAFDLPFIVNNVEVARLTQDLRLFINQKTTNNGSNAGMQYSSLIANRSQLRENQYGANNAGGGITTFKSRGLVIGDPITPAVPSNNVQVGDIIQGFTAIGLTDNGAGVGLIPLAYTQRVVVVKDANGSVACDWEVSLCPLDGATNSIRKAFGFTSEGIQKCIEKVNSMAGLVLLDATGTAVIPNTNVKSTTRFLLTVQDGGSVPTGSIYQSSRINGTSFTIKSNAGVADSGVQAYYQLYEQLN